MKLLPKQFIAVFCTAMLTVLNIEGSYSESKKIHFNLSGISQ